MRYYSAHSRRRGSSSRVGGTAVKTIVLVVGLVALFAYGIWWFRFGKGEAPDEVVEPSSQADVMRASPVSTATIAAHASDATEARLRDVRGGSASGTATRETDDGQFFLKLKADLPEINRDGYAYEAWLVRQVPYDYFSVGEFVTNDDGEWVVEWTGGAGKYDGYTQVVVTLEEKNGNPDPSGHVLNGEFE